jgi:hypothetical protein
MNTRALRAGVLIACLVSGFSTLAQTEFQISLKGTAYQTNSNGKIVSSRVNNQTLIDQAAAANGVSNKSLLLVYHIQGSTFGDTIDVVNASNGSVVSTPLGLYFGQDVTLGRTALTNANNTQVIELDYVYTPQNTHSMGAAFVTKRFPATATANSHPSMIGQIHWLVVGDATNTTQLVTGTFVVGKSLF